MHEEKSLKREIFVWFSTYSILLFLHLFYRYFLFEYALYSPLWPVLRWLDFIIEFGIAILVPIHYIGILGLASSFLTLIFTHQYLNLRRWQLISIYMLPHPFVVSLFQAHQAYFYHATDTPPWLWLLFGGVAYFLLMVTAYAVSKLFMGLSGEL